MPYMPEVELPMGALRTCKSDQLYCAFKIFNKMSSSAYKKVSSYILSKNYVIANCRNSNSIPHKYCTLNDNKCTHIFIIV